MFEENVPVLFYGASFFEHSCIPNVDRIVQADEHWLVANQDIPAGDRLYLARVKENNYELRTVKLARHGICCNCARCKLDAIDNPIDISNAIQEIFYK
jgi:Fe2+ or Zn2+ uptake regulation protein